MDHMLLVLKRSPEQEAAPETLVAQQQDQSSPNYHKWLAPEQIGARFGPSDRDIQTSRRGFSLREIWANFVGRSPSKQTSRGKNLREGGVAF